MDRFGLAVEGDARNYTFSYAVGEGADERSGAAGWCVTCPRKLPAGSREFTSVCTPPVTARHAKAQPILIGLTTRAKSV